MKKGTIIYIGGFILPDKNAAAHRVVNNAKAINEAGYDVVFINRIYNNSAEEHGEKRVEYFNFDCWEITEKANIINKYKPLYDISQLKTVFEYYKDVQAIIAYNFPAIALNKVRRYCKSRDIKCIGDITEWYGLKGRDILNMIAKSLDSTIRMRYINNRMDGLIVISEYLKRYYKSHKNVVCVPPLVDIEDKKWKAANTDSSDTINLIYAGSPSNEKERLDIIVTQIYKLSKKYSVSLDIVGIDKGQFKTMYKTGNVEYDSKNDVVTFHGVLSHEQTIKRVKQADYALIIRDDNRVTKAGFPTKFVESITCATPVIATDSSDLKKYIRDGINGYIVDVDNFHEHLKSILKQSKEITVEQDIFNYENYIKILSDFLEKVFSS